jgi:addiction module HigA family antidote
MHNPPHPGEIIRDACLEPLHLTVTAAAAALGVTRKTLNDLVNGHSGVSPEMALRLEQVFGSTADTWLGMQTAYDLWQARARAATIKVKRGFLAKSARRNQPDPLPAMLLGQLAIDRRFQGRGYARSLMWFALTTAVSFSKQVGCFGVLTHRSMTHRGFFTVGSASKICRSTQAPR